MFQEFKTITGCFNKFYTKKKNDTTKTTITTRTTITTKKQMLEYNLKDTYNLQLFKETKTLSPNLTISDYRKNLV